jgi:hypothetical protein
MHSCYYPNDALVQHASSQDFMRKQAIAGVGRAAVTKAVSGVKPFLGGLWRGTKNRVHDSFRHIGPDYRQMTGFFSKNPNAVSDALGDSRNLLNASGGITQPFQPGIASSFGHLRKNLGKTTEQLAAGTKNKFWTTDRSGAWLNRLTPTQRAEFDAARAAMQAGGQVDDVTKNFMRNSFGKEMGEDMFEREFARWGTDLGAAGNLGRSIGRRTGIGLGAAGVFAPAVTAPMVLGQWGGAASALPGMQDRAMRAAQQGAADQFGQFRNMSVMDRIRASANPNYLRQRLYQSDPGRGGMAHHFMYGQGQNQAVSGGGPLDYIRELAFPMIPGLGTNALDKSIEAGLIRNFQNMGSAKSANFIVNKALPASRQFFGGLASKAKSWIPRLGGKTPLASGSHLGGAGFRELPLQTPPMVPSRINNFVKQVGEHPLTAGMGLGLGVGMPVASFFGGRQQVNQAAELGGYGAGAAYGVESFSQLPFLGRMGAGIAPNAAMNYVTRQYPQLAQAMNIANFQGSGAMRM